MAGCAGAWPRDERFRDDAGWVGFLVDSAGTRNLATNVDFFPRQLKIILCLKLDKQSLPTDSLDNFVTSRLFVTF